MKHDKIAIVIWPDDTWCYKDDLEEYGWKSDDYKTLMISDNLSDEEIDTIVINDFQ